MRDMSKYGVKYNCFKCGCKFYDLNKPKAICPKCGVDQSLAPPKEDVEIPAVVEPEEKFFEIEDNEALMKDIQRDLTDNTMEYFDDYEY